MANGLYLPDGSFMRFDDGQGAPASLSKEIAVRSRSIDYYAIGSFYLPNPDPVLKAQGKDIQVYTDLLVDDRVGGGVINRVGAVKSMVWKIERGQANARQHKAVQALFATYDMDALFEAIIKGGRGYGYAPIELIWGQRDGLSLPLKLVAKPQRWFVFGQENDLRFRSRDHLMDGEELPPRTFVCPTNEASYDNPYGLGFLSRCFWPVVFKKGGWRFWIYFGEKYGQVWPVGKQPRSAGKEQRDQMLETLVQMVADGAAVIPDDGSVEFLESGTKTATSDLYRGIIAEANSAISTVWHGHAGAGESTTGKLGNDTTAVVVRDDLRDDDANLITRTMQQVINWIFEVNWGSSDAVCNFELKPREKIDTTQAQRDNLLSSSMARSGKRFTTAYYLKTYGLDPEDVEDAPATQQGPPPLAAAGNSSGQFADTANNAYPDQTTLDNAITDTSPAAMQNWVSGPLKPVLDLILKGQDLATVQEKLLSLYPKMDTKDLEEMLSRAFFVADCWGRLNA